jgi:hypothetical protein
VCIDTDTLRFYGKRIEHLNEKQVVALLAKYGQTTIMQKKFTISRIFEPIRCIIMSHLFLKFSAAVSGSNVSKLTHGRRRTRNASTA